MFDGRFVGFADFLVLRRRAATGSPTPSWRAHAKVPALLQLAAYADALAGLGRRGGAGGRAGAGRQAPSCGYRVGDLIPVYRSQRAHLQRLLDEHYAAGTPVRWDDRGRWSRVSVVRCASEQLRATDDLLLVAGMRVTQRDKLIDAGISTIAEPADHTGPVPDLAVGALGKLTAQAKLQVRQRDTGTPQFEIVDPQPLHAVARAGPG